MKKWPFIILIFLCINTPKVQADFNRMWIAMALSGKVITNYDVFQYLELKYMNSVIKSRLFSRSSSIYDYTSKKDQWLQERHAHRYNDTLRWLTWFTVLEYEAALARKNPQYNPILHHQKFFRVKRKTVEKRFNQLEKRSLAPIIRIQAIKIHAQQLKESSGSDKNPYTVYRLWKKKQIENLRKQMIIELTGGTAGDDDEKISINRDQLASRWHDFETRILKPIIERNYFDFRKRAVTIFAKELKKSFYPHPDNDYHQHIGEDIRDDDPTIYAIYRAWIKEQKQKIIEEIRLEEVKKMEIFGAQDMMHNLWATPSEIKTFYRVESEIFKKLIYKGLATRDVLERIRTNPRLRVVAKSLMTSPAPNISISLFKEMRPELFDQLRDEFVENIVPIFNDEQINIIVKYEDKTHRLLALKHLRKHKGNRERAITSLLEIKQFYASSHDYRDQLKSKLYDLAASLLEHSLEEQSFNKTLRTILSNIFNNITRILNDKSIFNNPRFSNHSMALIVSNLLSKNLNEKIITTTNPTHWKKILDWTNWYLKLKINQAINNNSSLVLVGELDSFYQAQKRINSYIYQQRLARGIKSYRKHLIEKHAAIFLLDPHGEGPLSTKKKIEFLLSAKSSK